ncbi:MAG: hypothetical protein GXP55_21445 [Deltaproteobacteria bacterium]|nr:hypothetical protein [Deltaproteobacteria bacterium]
MALPVPAQLPPQLHAHRDAASSFLRAKDYGKGDYVRLVVQELTRWDRECADFPGRAIPAPESWWSYAYIAALDLGVRWAALDVLLQREREQAALTFVPFATFGDVLRTQLARIGRTEEGLLGFLEVGNVGEPDAYPDLIDESTLRKWVTGRGRPDAQSLVQLGRAFTKMAPLGRKDALTGGDSVHLALFVACLTDAARLRAPQRVAELERRFHVAREAARGVIPGILNAPSRAYLGDEGRDRILVEMVLEGTANLLGTLCLQALSQDGNLGPLAGEFGCMMGYWQPAILAVARTEFGIEARPGEAPEHEEAEDLMSRAMKRAASAKLGNHDPEVKALRRDALGIIESLIETSEAPPWIHYLEAYFLRKALGQPGARYAKIVRKLRGIDVADRDACGGYTWAQLAFIDFRLDGQAS